MASENQMVRTIKLDTTDLQATIELLQGLEGVDAVEPTTPQSLRIRYDFSKISWGTLCEQMKSSGVYRQNGILSKWRDGWRDFKEENMRANLRHSPACCSKPPVGAGKK